MSASKAQLEQSRFWKKYLRLTRGRVPTLRALEVVSGEVEDDSLKKALSDVRLSVEDGLSLSDAMKKHPLIFSPSILELVMTAEKIGAWDEIIQEIIGGLEDGTFN